MRGAYNVPHRFVTGRLCHDEALFVLDRRERFNDEMGVIWLPGQVFEQQYYTPVLNPRTGAPLAVPALVVPEYDEFVRVR